MPPAKRRTDALEPLLTTKEVAALWEVCPRTVGKLIRRGEIPAPVNRHQTHWRFRAADIRRALEKTR